MANEFNSKTNFSSRLELAIQQDGRPKGIIAQKVGVKPPVMSRWLNQGVQPDSENVNKLARVLNLSVHWLLTGDGAMRPEGVLKEQYTDLPQGALPVYWIPVISWAHAGEAATYEELPQHWQDRLPVATKTERGFGLVVEGDSMSPRCEPGDVVVIEPDKSYHNGCLVVAKIKNDGVVLRRFMRLPDGRIRLIPYNEMYPAMEYGPEAFHWIYLVVSNIRRESA